MKRFWRRSLQNKQINNYLRTHYAVLNRFPGNFQKSYFCLQHLQFVEIKIITKFKHTKFNQIVESIQKYIIKKTCKNHAANNFHCQSYFTSCTINSKKFTFQYFYIDCFLQGCAQFFFWRCFQTFLRSIWSSYWIYLQLFFEDIWIFNQSSLNLI